MWTPGLSGVEVDETLELGVEEVLDLAVGSDLEHLLDPGYTDS